MEANANYRRGGNEIYIRNAPAVGIYIYVNSLSLSPEAGANCHRVVVKRRRKFSRVPAYVPCVHANCGKGSGVCFWLGI